MGNFKETFVDDECYLYITKYSYYCVNQQAKNTTNLRSTWLSKESAVGVERRNNMFNWLFLPSKTKKSFPKVEN